MIIQPYTEEFLKKALVARLSGIVEYKLKRGKKTDEFWWNSISPSHWTKRTIEVLDDGRMIIREYRKEKCRGKFVYINFVLREKTYYFANGVIDSRATYNENGSLKEIIVQNSYGKNRYTETYENGKLKQYICRGTLISI